MKKKAFTLAEVLIVIGIIGIIAECTIPVLFMNVRKQETSVRLKGFYSNFNQAISLSEIDNGNANDWDKAPGDLKLNDGSEDYSGQANASYSFFMKYLAPYLKYTKADKGVYDSNNPSAYYETKVYLADGSTFYLHNGGCMDIVLDTNGDQKPNFEGTDEFRFLFCLPPVNTEFFGRSDKTFGAYYETFDRATALSYCKTNGAFCSRVLQLDGWEFKDDYPYKL